MTSPAAEPLSPVTTGERIEELDVVRGFALLGIFLMNVEFFGRSLIGIGEGMPPGLTGADWFASWFIAYFVQGKFWTIFALLFGMGFAVMLGRAERAQRAFLVPYLRRILALAVFGALHCIFLWAGDILFSYAIGAGALLIVLYGKWRPVLIALVVLVGLIFVPGLGGTVGQIASSLAFTGLLAIYLRSEKAVKRLPLFSFIFSILGLLGAIAAIVLWALPEAPKEPRIPVTAISASLLLIAFLSAKYRDPAELRSLRLGVSVYMLMPLVMVITGAVRYLSPPDPADPVVQSVAAAGAGSAAPSAASPQPGAAPSEGKAAAGAAESEAAKKKTERAKRLAELEERRRNEERVLSTGTYAEAVEMRAREFPERAANEAGFAVIATSMFLIGLWFVRSGVMENVGAHLRLFRKFVYYGLPVGIGLGLAGSLIATSHTRGATDGFQLARGLAVLGSLPASLGYVGLIVLALHSSTVFAKLRVLAPAGRMALTNYLAQSLISTFVFYGYGAGHWGLARSWQVVYVFAVFALQVAFSHWWLARFRYGPMEWLWRAFTYRKIPPLRLSLPPA